MDRYSATNALLIYKQCPEATQLKDFDGWREENVRIKKGAKSISILFALIPDNDSSFNFLVSILYTQLFQQLFYSADHIHGGALPVPVHFLMDEFANETQL